MNVIAEMAKRIRAAPKLALVALLTLVATSAQAGLLDFVTESSRAPFEAPPLFSTQRHSQFQQVAYPMIQTRADCAPSFTPGDDGIFKRTQYCHRDFPKRVGAFLEQGADVPASFLVGFTEEDVLARWREVPIQIPEFIGSDVAVPSELFTLINVKAAQAWGKLLACNDQDPDRAREMYRSGVFRCSDEAALRSLLADIRSSIPTMANSLEGAVFFDVDRVNAREREIKDRLDQLNQEREGLAYGPKYNALLSESTQLYRQETRLRQWRILMEGNHLSILLEGYRPKLPRLHPLLAQVMIEEMLTLIKPQESPSGLASRLKKNPDQKNYLYQLVLWTNAVANRGCAAQGLWPSASRAALDAFGQLVVESTMEQYGYFRTTPRRYILVDCPLRESNPVKLPSWGGLPSTLEDTSGILRLTDGYATHRVEIWREFLGLRERQTKIAR